LIHPIHPGFNAKKHGRTGLFRGVLASAPPNLTDLTSSSPSILSAVMRMTLRPVLLALPILQALGDCSDESCAVKDRSLLQKHAMAGMSKADDLSEIERPPRIFQHFIPEPSEPSETIVGTDPGVCEKDIFARKDLCPQQCPFAAEMESRFCHFRCVSKMQCGDPSTGTLRNASIPDEKMHLCRHCQVEACQTCKAGPPGASGTALERCVKCFPGYTLTAEGECEMKGEGFFVAIGVVGAIAVVVAAVWYLSVVFKPRVNQEGISEGLEGQNRAMLTMPTQPGEEARPYPLSTNLLTTNVAGTGTMLFFRFQFALLVWAISLLALWFGFVFLVSKDLLILGNREAKSPQVLCRGELGPRKATGALVDKGGVAGHCLRLLGARSCHLCHPFSQTDGGYGQRVQQHGRLHGEAGGAAELPRC